MTTRLDTPIKREVTIGGELYTLTLGPESVDIVRKGARKGVHVTWESLLEGSPQLQRDLLLSLAAAKRSESPSPGQKKAPPRKRR